MAECWRTVPALLGGQNAAVNTGGRNSGSNPVAHCCTYLPGPASVTSVSLRLLLPGMTAKFPQASRTQSEASLVAMARSKQLWIGKKTHVARCPQNPHAT